MKCFQENDTLFISGVMIPLGNRAGFFDRFVRREWCRNSVYSPSAYKEKTLFAMGACALHTLCLQRNRAEPQFDFKMNEQYRRSI